MSRFNVRHGQEVENFEGGQAFKLSNELALYSMVCTSLISPQYYRPNTEDQLNELRNLITNNDPDFVAKLAVYAREKMFMRTIPLVLLVELARRYTGAGVLKKAVARVISRPDEITELLAYYMKANNTTKLNRVAKQLIKGIKLAANKFDEYQYSKWNRDGAITLKKALRIVHPVPKDNNQSDIFRKICSDSLDAAYTWETEFAELGRRISGEILSSLYEGGLDVPAFSSLKKLLHHLNINNHPKHNDIANMVARIKAEAKKVKWEELIDSNRLGYQATLMNLRNILMCDVSDAHIDKVAGFIANPQSVQKSKMFPFRYLSAYRMLIGASLKRHPDAKQVTSNFVSGKLNRIIQALNTAAQYSIGNIDFFDDNISVLLASDVSGSMFSPISPRSVIRNYDIGLLLSSLVKGKLGNQATVGIFGTTWEQVDIETDSPLDAVDELYKIEGRVGYSTNGWRVLEWALDNNLKFDRILMFTDCQLYNSDTKSKLWQISGINRLWTRYRERHPEAKLYLFDLAGYGTTPIKINDNGVHLIAGFNNEIFKVLKNLENGRGALENINNIEL